MQEIVPLLFGALVGVIVTYAPLPPPKWTWFVAGSVIAGAAGTWINGEMTSSFAPLFLSFDAFLAWCGAASSVAALRAYRELRSR